MTKAAEAVLATPSSLTSRRALNSLRVAGQSRRPADPDAEAAWEVEIVRRVAAIEPVPSSWSPGRTEAPDRERNPRPVKRTVRAGEPASEELVDAVRWYEARRPGLGGSSRCRRGDADADRARPEIGSPGSSDPQTRRVLVPRFPYQVVTVSRRLKSSSRHCST